MALVVYKRFQPVVETGTSITYRFRATATRGGFASEIPARGALLSALTGDAWTDSDYQEPKLVRSRRLGPERTLKIQVELAYKGRANIKLS